MPTSLFQGIPNGLFRMTGEPDEGYIIGVSDEVPIIIKPHFAMSEHDEFMIYGLNDKDRTLHSEKNMLRIIGSGEDVKKKYVDNKLKLYLHILEKSAGNLEAWGFNQEDFNGFQRAVEFLKEQI